MKLALRLIVPLVLLLLALAYFTIVSLGGNAAGDSCGGCDKTPGWAYVGSELCLLGLAAWVLAVGVVILRRRGRTA